MSVKVGTGQPGAPGVDAPTTVLPTSITNDYTIALTDSLKVIEANSSSSIVVTIPAGLPTGFVTEVFRFGTGTLTVAPGSGVTLVSQGGLRAIAAQYTGGSLRHRGADFWVLEGNVG